MLSWTPDQDQSVVIASIKHPDRRTLRSTQEICEGLQKHFEVRFTQQPDPLVHEFGNYLADSPCLKVASCEGRVIEQEILTVLKEVGCNKSPRLDGLPYELYLRLSPMFIPILMDVFNHWFIKVQFRVKSPRE